MYIFLDESGVHKQDGFSSVALAYVSIKSLDELQRSVLATEQKLGIHSFRWSHSAWEVRKEFINAICKHNFSIKAVLIKNPFYDSQHYEYVLQHLIIEKNIHALIIDGKKGRAYELRLKKILRSKGISVNKLRSVSDTGYSALRLADAIAGIIRYHHEHPHHKLIRQLYRKIASKIIVVIQ